MSNGNVFISGASRGIGNSIAYHFAENDYVVVGTSRNEFEFDKKIKNLIPVKLDVTSREDIQNCFNDLKTKNLLPDILINNAGITSDQIFLRMKDEEWENVINVNLYASMILTRHVIKGMLKRKFGRIIFISSIVGFTGNPGQANYSASKSALSGLTKSIALEVAARGITCNLIAPGFISTPMTDKLTDDQKNKIIVNIPANRLGNAEDISNGCIYLASDEASFITGTTLHINGGMSMI